MWDTEKGGVEEGSRVKIKEGGRMKMSSRKGAGEKVIKERARV